MVDNPMSDRERGILSPADREFLIATEEELEEKYTRQARAKRQQAIRDRVYEAVLDFMYLYEFWPADPRKEVFTDLLADWQGRTGLADMLALVYIELVPRERFDDIFERGVRQAEERMHDGKSGAFVRVRPIDEVVEWMDEKTIEEAIAKLGQGKRGLMDLTDDETRALAQLFYYSGSDETELKSALDALQRAEYEQRGGRDTRRKENWLRGMHKSKEWPEPGSESTDSDTNGE